MVLPVFGVEPQGAHPSLTGVVHEGNFRYKDRPRVSIGRRNVAARCFPSHVSTEAATVDAEIDKRQSSEEEGERDYEGVIVAVLRDHDPPYPNSCS